jgi:hypothetical protein
MKGAGMKGAGMKEQPDDPAVPAVERIGPSALKAEVVFERQDGFDMQSGPYGYERVGFRIGSRVFWTGCAGSGMPASTYAEDRELAETIVARWNDVR